MVPPMSLPPEKDRPYHANALTVQTVPDDISKDEINRLEQIPYYYMMSRR